MEKKTQDTLVYLLGGVGIMVVLGGVFGIYNLFYGLVAGFFLWIVGGAIGKLLMGLLGSIGFVFVLVKLLHFQWPYVLLGTIAIWVIFGALKRYT